MKATQILRPPQNWQDFETLCKKLWGEIWKCSEIKKNGRSGQKQNGVDISGIPKDENRYYGIQCKGKDTWNRGQFTESEINEEIEKAKGFNPPLKKFYLATTALKDVGIEEYIRKRNLENIGIDQFEIHLYSWEDIVDLIDENKETHNWYVNSQNFKSKSSVKVTFHSGRGLNTSTLKPKFKKIITHYVVSDLSKVSSKEKNKVELTDHKNIKVDPVINTNHSYTKFHIIIRNTGDDPIDDFQLLFKIEPINVNLSITNKFNVFDAILGTSSMSGISSDIQIDMINSFKIVPNKNSLVKDDFYKSSEVFIKLPYETRKAQLNWKLISRNYQVEGIMELKINPEIEEHVKYVSVKSISQKEIEEKIEDYII